MICKVCNRVPNPSENEECFEKALDVLKQHYTFYKNALEQRDLELQQIKERNEKLNKALLLLQNQQQPAKRFKSQHGDDYWSGNNSSQEERANSDLSIIDDEPMGVTNLNMALNSEQLFDTSALSQSKNNVSLTSSSELIQSPRTKESPKRNKQRDIRRCLKDRNKSLERSKSEWNIKDRNSPAEISWAMKLLQPDKNGGEVKKCGDKKLCLSLKKPNPSKIKQSLLNFNKPSDGSIRESEDGEDIIDASPVIPQKNTKAGRSWAHRSGHNYSSNTTSNNSSNALVNVTTPKDDDDVDTNKTLDDIVFDFSPSKKTDDTLDLNSPKTTQPKQLKFDNNDISTDCTSLPNEHLSISTNKNDTSSVVILTPSSEDIIFVDDTCDYDQEIDTMDLLGDNLEKLKKYESKCIQKQQTKELDVFKKPKEKMPPANDIKPINKIKQEKITQDLKKETTYKLNEEKPSCSSTKSSLKTPKTQNPLLDEFDTEDEEDFMPKPFIVKQEPKLTIKQRFNIECEDCEKLINFLDKGLTDAQIQQHLDKCKYHNNGDIMRQNTPKDFWNPFILSFQADDPRNVVLIDNRFKDSKK
ncbi:uncharacterized protein CtIP isoform X2 [Calliphora vicina]|uniref:uncharacterized protein CtIP isoform X2 n=1 Tax=Calliphora vicina TaxID=7373 RepID=UPI00325A44E1